MDEQQKVASFFEEHEMGVAPTYRLLDLVSELGEVAKDAAESTGYGEAPEKLDINSDEICDALFSLLALADAVEIEADGALDEALAKSYDRTAEADTASSGS